MIPYMDGGAALIVSEEDLHERVSLLDPSLGMGDELRIFADNFRSGVTDQARHEWPQRANSETALVVIRRFAAIEGDVANPGTKGLGRVSSAGFPRLGGVLHAEATKKGAPTDPIVFGVERTAHAAYLAVVGLTSLGERKRIYDDHAEGLWEAWIPNAYAPVADSMMEVVYGLAAIAEYWERLLISLGMKKNAKGITKRGSDIGRSIGGLAGIGATLAFVERGSQRE